MTTEQLYLFNGLCGLVVVVFAVLGPMRDYQYMTTFPEWDAYAPGVAPVLAISVTYVLPVVVGHGVMRWSQARPAEPPNNSFKRSRVTFTFPYLLSPNMRTTSKLLPRFTTLLITVISVVYFSASALAQSHRPQHEQPTQPQCADEPDLINADRPGIADGSTVIGAGTFQIESGIQQEFRRSGDSREHTFFVPTLLRFGVDSHWEVRIEGNTFTRVTTSDSTGITSGFAPVSLGFKYHIYKSTGCHQFSLGTIGRVFPAWGSKEFRTQHTTADIRLVADWDFAP